MVDLDSIHFKKRNDFRNWLIKNSDKSQGIWMVYFKKRTGKENISYDDALEEAICFGWIDSLVKKIDEETYVRKFTPRTNIKNWSEVNKLKALKMIKEGRMTEAGFNKLGDLVKAENINRDRKKPMISPKDTEIPIFIIDAFAQNESVLSNFNKLAPSHKKNYVLWIINAKREETVRKRLAESIELLKKNKKLGLK